MLVARTFVTPVSSLVTKNASQPVSRKTTLFMGIIVSPTFIIECVLLSLVICTFVVEGLQLVHLVLMEPKSPQLLQNANSGGNFLPGCTQSTYC